MHFATHNLVIHVSDYVVHAQTGQIGWTLWVYLDHQMLYGVHVTLAKIDLDGTDGEAKTGWRTLYAQRCTLFGRSNHLSNWRLHLVLWLLLLFVLLIVAAK